MRTRVIFFASGLIVPCSARRGWLDCTVMARFGFVRACARSQVAVGILFMVLGPVLAGAALLWWPTELTVRVPAEWRGFVPPLAALLALVLGIVIGSRLVLRGQLVLMLIETRRALARIE